MTRLQEGKSLTVEDRISLLGIMSFVLICIFALLSISFNPKVYQRKLAEIRKTERRNRPWKILSFFQGCLHPERQLPEKHSRTHSLQKLALSDDFYSQAAACSALVSMADDLASMIPSVLSEDLFTLCRMSSAPAAAVAQRIPICLALLCCSPTNREIMCTIPPAAIRSIVAGARAASCLKQAGAALATHFLAHSKPAATLLVRMGILEPLSAMLDDRRGIGSDSFSDNRRLAAALALARLAECGSGGEDRRLFATQSFLRAILNLARSNDQRLQLCSASIIAAIASNEVMFVFFLLPSPCFQFFCRARRNGQPHLMLVHWLQLFHSYSPPVQPSHFRSLAGKII